ncbi:MAG TPA: DUF1236 domain-containing protein [Bradyrhizobium sp.]|nr:DUF1236 domain-containing protein [Bradyrhizobium sp.]
MTNRFLISVAAAALIAGTGFANAQGMNREGGAAGSSVQQSAPSSDRGGGSSATQHRDAAEPSSGTKSDQRSQGAVKNQQAEDSVKGQKSQQNTASDADKTKAGKDMKAEGRDGSKMNNAQSKEGMSKDSTTTQSREGMSKDSTTTTQSREGRPSGTNAAQDTKSGSSSSTVGNAATSATAAPPAEKRTQIVSAIRQERIEETTNVNFNIAVGATIPGTVRFHPIPARIVEIYPEWRGYEVILVKGRYVIVRPQTHEIVYIIEG